MTQTTIAGRLDSEEERAAGALIDAAARLLNGDRIDGADRFVALLFGRPAPEDLVGYGKNELAALARDA